MHTKPLHNWNLSYAQARDLQTVLARKVRLQPLKYRPRTIAGLDCAFSRDKTSIAAVVVVMTYPALEILQTVSATAPVTFPYISGLLSFREAPVCLDAIAKLDRPPDLLLIDGQGIAHPRRLGLASHLGLFLDRPTIGCAKSRLIGDYEPPGPDKGSFSPLMHNDQQIGAVLRTRTAVKPLFISPGHKCTIDDAIKITLNCTTKYRLPQPTRTAHQLVTKLKTNI